MIFLFPFREQHFTKLFVAEENLKYDNVPLRITPPPPPTLITTTTTTSRAMNYCVCLAPSV